MLKLRKVLSAFAFRTTRGRRGALLAYSGLVTLALFALSLVIATRARELSSHVDAIALTDLLCMMLLGATIFVVAPAIVAAQVAEERRSGTLDLLRTAPLSPTMLAAGFITGAPSSVYLLASGPLAFHVLAGLLGRYPFHVLPESLLVLGAGGLAAILVAMLASLTITRESGGAATPMIVAVGSGLVTMSASGLANESSAQPWAFLHPAGALGLIYQSFAGPYRTAFTPDYVLAHAIDAGTQPWLNIERSFAVLVYSAIALVLLVAVRRALAGDPPSRFTKLEALVLFALACAALLVPLVATQQVSELRASAFCFVSALLVLPYVLCVLGATPNAIAYGAGRAPAMSAYGAPLLVATAMIATAILMALALCGTHVVRAFANDGCTSGVVAFCWVALTFPVYALFSSTRISTPGLRVAFWAMIAVHLALQIPTWLYLCGSHPRDGSIESLLAGTCAVIGVLLPLFIAWRQHVGNRKLAAA